MCTVDKIMAYENDEMTMEEIKEFFQEMVDSGLVWQLQGHYQKVARSMLSLGEIVQRS